MSGKISLSLGAGRKAPAPTNGVKRTRDALQDDDEDTQDFGRAEKVSHFDSAAGGAIDESRKTKDEGPLIIPRQFNREWKESANMRKRQKSGLPGEGNGLRANGDMDQKMKDVEAEDVAKKPGYGLNLYKQETNGDHINGRAEEDAAEPVQTSEASERDSPKRKSDDELARDALLGKTTTDKSLTIQQTEPMTESDAFRHDYQDAPDMATVDDYVRVPVEQFGAAMLRGMGWKDGEGIGSQKGKKLPKETNKVPERRAALLGIGAKEDKTLVAEMGAWGKNARGGKEVKIYNPVLLRDKATGKMYTEEELHKKREKDERAKYEEEFERKEKERGKRKRDEDGDSRDRRRGDSRDRKRDKDGNRQRRRRDEESDEEYYRRKEKERRRRREDDDNYDRERSRRHRHRDDRHGYEKDSRRDRDRDRDRRR